VVGLEASDPGDGVLALDALLRFLGQRGVHLRVAPAHGVGLAFGLQPLERVLADRLQHLVAAHRAGDEALVREGGDPVERVRAAHGLGRLERPAAGEHAEPREELALAGLEQVVAPAHRAAQRLLASGRVAGSGAEGVEAVL
jgi:hypothetical protein